MREELEREREREGPSICGEAIVICSIPGMTERYLPDGRVRGLGERRGEREAKVQELSDPTALPCLLSCLFSSLLVCLPTFKEKTSN